MKPSLRKSIGPLFAVLIFLCAANISFGALLPQDLVMEEVFTPGYGHPVGKVRQVQGQVVILHKEDQTRGFWAQKDLPLYKGDVIVTQDDGRIRFEFNDQSSITLAPLTKLAITESVYDPSNKTRSTFINLAIGKARFWAQKLADFKRSQFKVKTPTAILGVRGSKWIVEIFEAPAENIPLQTRVTALEKTILWVLSTAALEAEPMLLYDFEQTLIAEFELPTEKVRLPPEIIEQLKEPFKFAPQKEEVPAKVAAAEAKLKKKAAVATAFPLFVSVEAPEEPEAMGQPEAFEEPETTDIVENQQISEQLNAFIEQQTNIVEQIAEDTVVLPGFPGPPG